MSKNFKETIQTSNKPVVINFSATWCGPCRMFAPIFDQVQSDLSNDFAIEKCDIDECEQFANENNIASVPTTIVYKDGRETARRSGAFPNAETFESWIKQNS